MTMACVKRATISGIGVMRIRRNIGPAASPYCVLYRRGDTGERLPYHFGHPRFDPVELLKPVSDVHESLKSRDLLPLEHVPGRGRQIETVDGPAQLLQKRGIGPSGYRRAPPPEIRTAGKESQKERSAKGSQPMALQGVIVSPGR